MVQVWRPPAVRAAHHSQTRCFPPYISLRRTKLEGERAVQAQWPNHAILRSSIIYGPDPPLVPVERPLLLQFIDECLTAKVGLCVAGVGC